jgi:hypothetical protein
MNACIILKNTLAWDITGTRGERSCLDLDPGMLYEAESEKDCQICIHSFLNVDRPLGTDYFK